MNKQEAIEKIKDLYSFVMEDGPFEVDLINKNQVIDLVSQIDKPQKVVVPKFVAEWLEWCKANDVTLLGGISPIDELGSTICSEKRVKSRDATRWAKRNQETFARAWLDGFEIEQEKLYTVEIPNPNSKSYMNVLKRVVDGIIVATLCRPSTSYFKHKEFQLTEAEIKQDFDWAFQFAKEVVE